MVLHPAKTMLPHNTWCCIMCTRCVLSQHASLNMQVLSCHAAMEEPAFVEFHCLFFIRCCNVRLCACVCGCVQNTSASTSIMQAAHRHLTDTSQTPHRHLTNTSQSPQGKLRTGGAFLFLNKRKKEGTILLFIYKMKNSILAWVSP